MLLGDLEKKQLFFWQALDKSRAMCIKKPWLALKCTVARLFQPCARSWRLYSCTVSTSTATASGEVYCEMP